MKFLSYKQLECVLLENDSISVRYLFFGSHLNMEFCGFTVNFMQKIAKCYGDEYVLTIKEKMFTGTIMFSSLGQLMKERLV